ncbi:MAG: DUF2892 domain-containing protein [Nitrospinaceae bacterium]|nr:DUF2892 domain-containing protein [Nitrospinaceae bacterium]NIR54565.1 DUF2892 domain-containing protein [Nitrospinaceae bacterium]NIS84984.1 DUF2892 domain-containing protein [Nitrospinaceae bacterium]NIT81795.1 DUF2892 domain-containing protein [Nitrospinaceae bacterium]NIU46285.1 DUF2892 domain-containing protein [Nitrospinaceae bacterium]
MCTELWIRRIAGTFILASLALGVWVNPWWLLFTAFVGANLLQSSFTRWCLMEDILHKLGVKDAAQPDADSH